MKPDHVSAAVPSTCGPALVNRITQAQSPLLESQKEVIEKIVRADVQGVRRQLLVAPNGWDRREVLLHYLRQRISSTNSQPSKSNLHVVIIEQTGTLRDIVDLVRKSNFLSNVRQIVWSEDFESGDLSQLISIAQENPNQPILLLSTANSLQKSLHRSGWSEGLRRIAEVLSTIAFDESSVAGGAVTHNIVSRLLFDDNRDVRLFGMSTVPTLTFQGIHDLFHDALWVYLPESSTFRNIHQVIEQLAIGIQRGELTPLEHTYMMTPENLGIQGQSLFTMDAQRKPRLDPGIYGVLFSRLHPLFASHEKGFVAVGTIEEAGLVSEYLNRHFADKKFAVFHSGLSTAQRAQLENDFRSNKIQFLVTVKYLDDDLRFPEMSLYVDLNKNLNAIDFLRRLGNVLGVHHGKRNIDVATFLEIDHHLITDILYVYAELLKGALSLGGIKKRVPIEPSNRLGHGLLEYEISNEKLLKELNKLRATQLSFWNAHLTEAEKVADELSDFIEQSRQMPSESTHLRLLLRVRKHSKDSLFIRRLRLHPYAWAIFQNSMIPEEIKIANQVIRFVHQYDQLPTLDVNQLLYERMDRLHENILFVSQIRQSRRSFELFEYLYASPAVKTAIDIIIFFHRTKELPKSKSGQNESALYRKFFTYVKHPEFVDRIRRERDVLKAVTYYNANSAERVALKLIDFFDEHQRPMRTSDMSVSFYQRFATHKKSPELWAMLRTAPKAMAAYSDFDPNDGPSVLRNKYLVEAAADVIEFINKAGRIPSKINPDEKALTKRYYRFRTDPLFQELLRNDPISKKVLDEMETPVEVKNPNGAEVAVELIHFFQKYAYIPKANSRNSVKHLDEVSQTEGFLNRLKESKVVYDAWLEHLVSIKVRDQDQLEYEEMSDGHSFKRVTYNSYKKMIKFISANGRIPVKSIEDSKYGLFLGMYHTPEFLTLIKRNEIAWRIFSDSKYSAQSEAQSDEGILASAQPGIVRGSTEKTMPRQDENRVRGKSKKTLSQYDSMIDLIAKNGEVPQPNKPGYWKFLGMYKDPIFQQMIRENAVAWNIFKRSQYVME